MTAALFCVTAIATMGVEACVEPKEYCTKAYTTKYDIKECTSFCVEHKDFVSKESDVAQALMRACGFGQLTYLSGPRASGAEPSLECDRNFKDQPVEAVACRTGVAAEELRTSKSRTGPGSSSDRETGNRK